MTNRAVQADLLEQRIAENRASQTIDLPEWIFDRVQIGPSDRILELCCGTGGQTLPMLDRLGSEGRLWALDVSAEVLRLLRGKVNSPDLPKLTTIPANLDQLSPVLESERLRRPAFDLVFCAYGLYYSQDAEKTLDEIRTWLKPHGRIVVVGPYGPNNKPLFDLMVAAGVELSEAVTSSSGTFMLQTVVPWGAVNFGAVRISSMVNPVRWASAERVLNYWQNTTFYDAQKRAGVEALLARHFRERSEFVNEKWVMMVEMQDARA